ncbi:MAG: hypothetical protein VB071_12975 [Lawsonibacter sp.]|nr:hypothetical protein [Lawsonibacter sp.]
MEHLPWESVPGPIYSARDLKPRKKWVTVAGWFMCALLILGGIITPYRVAAVFGVLYVLALLMKKDTVVTVRGLEIYYQMQITTHHDFWGWDEIGSVVREEQDHPELVALYFSRGDRVKRLFFPKADAEKIMVLAKERNPKIVVGDADEVQMIGYQKKKK